MNKEIVIIGLTLKQIIELRKFWLMNHEELPFVDTAEGLIQDILSQIQVQFARTNGRDPKRINEILWSFHDRAKAILNESL